MTIVGDLTMNEELQTPTEIHFIVPSFQNEPVIYITGSDRSLGAGNLQQLNPMIYEDDAWHLYATVTQPIVSYRFISLKTNIIFQRTSYVRKDLSIVDEECPPQDPLSRCSVIGALMMQDRKIQCDTEEIPSQPYFFMAFIPFLPRNAQPVIMAQNVPQPWVSPIYLKYRGNRYFSAELAYDIGEFKLCLLYNDGTFEWEGQLNRCLYTKHLPVQYNIVFSHTRRFHFEFHGVYAPKFRDFAALDDFIKTLDHYEQFIVINPFYANSCVGLDFQFNGEFPELRTMLTDLDEFFGNEAFESAIVSLAVREFLVQEDELDSFLNNPYIQYKPHIQKRIFTLFWNSLHSLDEREHIRLISLAWRQMYFLKRLILLKQQLWQIGKILAVKTPQPGEMDEFLPLFHLEQVEYYKQFLSAAVGSETDVEGDFLQCQAFDEQIAIGDQIVIKIRPL